MPDYLDEVFGDGGIFASRFSSYEPRPGQVALARLVDQAMRGGRHALGEGPCGVGKGIAYCVPAVWHAVHRQKRVLIATANIALQEQLAQKDLPLLASVLPWPFTFALLKGRNNYACLSGDTRVLTRNGIRSIRDISGTAVVLLDGDGNWTPSHVESFGAAPLMKVVLRRGRVEKVIHATADHRWFTLVERDRKEVVETTTAGLRPGDRLPVVQPCPIAKKLRPSPFGVAHGITFGDGTVFGATAKGWRTATVVLHGEKKRELLRYFSESHFKDLLLSEAGYAEDAVRVCDLPTFFKELPSLDEAPSYLYGWLAGYVATDGCVSNSGEVTLTSANREHLEFVETVCLRLGIATGPIRDAARIGIGQDEPTPLHALAFVAAALSEDFLLRVDHRERFVSVERVRPQRTPWVVAAVEATERVEEVFCAIVPTTHSFVLEGYLLTGNCLDRMAESEATGELQGFPDDDQQRQVDELLAWADTTSTGDVSELPFIPTPPVWSRFSVSSDDCKGDQCAFRDQCFAERARKNAADADLVVTNYHLLFAHLLLRRETGLDLVLPPFDYVVLDEAHEAAEIARDFLGFSCSEFAVRRLSRAAVELGEGRLSERLAQAGSEFFTALADHARSSAYKCRLRSPGFIAPDRLDGVLSELEAAAKRVAESEELGDEVSASADRTIRRSVAFRARLQEATALLDREKVYFIDIDARGRARLVSKAIDVSDFIRQELFDKMDSVTLVSATLTTERTFTFVRNELGIPDDALELIVDSPFNFQEQALLIVPEGLPDPRDADFPNVVAQVVEQVIESCNGRTLALFTSYKTLSVVHERIRRGKHRVLRQGELPRTTLARIFKQDTSSVLLGTDSFWTGIDVPGEALTGLVIDKLPFPNLDDPIVDAISARDPNAFCSYLVPRAIILFRQGVGRLIRSQSDVGVVVILDRRIAEKAYGKRFLQSLPPMMATRKLENIPRFLQESVHASTS